MTDSKNQPASKLPSHIAYHVRNVAVPEGVAGQDEAGRLWDIFWMLRFAIRKATQGQDRLSFALYVHNDNRRPKLVKLIVTCGALDMDDQQPAITVMPDED